MSHSKQPKLPTLEASAHEVERLSLFYANLAERCEALTEENIALRDVIQDDQLIRSENLRLSHENMDLRKRVANMKTEAVRKLMPLRELQLWNDDDDL